MTRLSKTDKYAILWLSHTGLHSAEISQELKISEENITKVLEKATPMSNDNKISTGSEPVKSNNLMINETAGKKTKSVSIMTGAASQENDRILKEMKPSSSRHTGAIFRPNNG